MKTFELKGEVRDDFGKKAARAFRSEGLILVWFMVVMTAKISTLS